ncbi:hypothetical protein B0H67DRAFT_578144 [Lasiosphaeris hirsuta]|uniref:Very long-chain fatty acid transport protein n=1 Tax=Lasiosphaeris hirsuta TaxID=260670 RepID=A0AA40ASB1_9PEZI|nr:hypothetical protein B0H67DRAFT_578144 [Lasiosphaeris hirsuta]
MASLALTAAAASVAGAAYLNARLSLEHDVVFARIFGRAVIKLIRASRAGRVNLFYVLEEHAQSPATAQRPFLLFEGAAHTYAATYDAVLRYGSWLREMHGVREGDVVALDFTNSAAFVFLWFALWAVGATPAFINHNLTGAPLTHSLRASAATLAIVDPRLEAGLTEEVRGELPAVRFVVFSPEVEAEAAAAAPARYMDEVRNVESYVGMAILIYTSGTTGLPKPAVVSWGKIYMAAMMAVKGMSLKGNDIFYVFKCMPLYHSSASCIGVASVLFAGAAVSLGRRFSTKTFWKEARETKATGFLYVGETCRYLTVTPAEIDPVTGENLDKKHNVRIAMGNGLRPDVWDKFKERFGIDTIFEFYAATEGALGLWNLSRNDFAKGAIGRYGVLSKAFVASRSAIVRLDFETEAPWRDPRTGFCQRAHTGEAGELVVQLPSDDVGARFQGYFGNSAATDSKIARGVFRPGDAWFRSGDVLRWDGVGDGRLYFSDRIGDTFRWKSENVSTAEVAQALGTHPAVLEANVYGVQLPHHDGRAGCVALAIDQPLASEELLASLAKHARDNLPKYAVPLFLRIVQDVGLQNTGTNKQQKNGLRNQSVDPAKMLGDSVFWLRDGTYAPFGQKEWRAMEGGDVKL